MRIRLLGPVDWVDNGVTRTAPGLRGKAILAALALRSGQIVSADKIVDIVWDGAPTTANNLQSHISHLRRMLRTRAVIQRRGTGYMLEIADPATDLAVAEQLIRDSAELGDPAKAAYRLHEAVELWRGRPLADLAGLPWFDAHAQRLEQLLLRTRLTLTGHRLSLGEHNELLPELQLLGQEHPLDEQIHGHIMLALYRAGRQADALDAYHRLRLGLSDALGIEPGQALRDLQTAILRQDPALDLSAATPTVANRDVPAQLPSTVATFIGRREELARLDSLAAEPDNRVAPITAVIAGTAGVGKTALAVQWSQRAAVRFPDGQLYVNLRGFDPSGTMLTPEAALCGFLEVFTPQRIPADLAGQAALYRSLLAGKRMLIVLDNARDAEQVRPLLPGTPGCMTVITSRSQLAPLIATEDAHSLTLQQLSEAEACELLTGRLGRQRTAAEPQAVDEIVARCARLPLALAIVAARAATQPGFALIDLAAELSHADGGLDALRAGDAATDVRAVLSWSYRALDESAARLLRLLGRQTGPDIGRAAVLSLAGLPGGRLGVPLAELVGGNLIVESAPGRYTMHDLLRAFAGEQGEAEHEAASQRLLDHYLHTAYQAALLLNPQRDPIDLAPPMLGVVPEHLAGHEQALAWFTAEHRNLVAAIENASALGLDTITWQLAWTLATFFNRQGHWRDWTASLHLALDAARRLGDAGVQARTHRSLSWAYIQLGQPATASAQLSHALELYTRTGDKIGRADTHLDLGRIVAATDFAGALHHARSALDLYQAGGHAAGQALALNNIGFCHAMLGNYREAVGCCRQSLRLQERLGNRDGQAGAWDSLGHAQVGLGRYDAAAASYRHAIDLYRALGDRYEEASSLTNLGDAYREHDLGKARTAWRQAVIILDELDHPDAQALHARLAR